VARVDEQRPGVGGLSDLPGVHHRDPVGASGDHPQIVGDQDHRHAQALPQVVDQLQDLLLDGHVQGGGRLVGDEQLRLAGQRHRDHHPLAHPTGELVRVLADALLGLRHPHQVEHFRGPLQGLVVAGAPVQLDRLGDLLAHRHRGIQRGQRILEDHADLVAADVAHVLVGEAADLLAVQLDAAAGDRPAGGQQLHDRQRGHRLAAPRLAHDAERLPGLQVQRYPVDRVHGGLLQPDLGPQVVDLK
jgi:hypothetical protein